MNFLPAEQINFLQVMPEEMSFKISFFSSLYKMIHVHGSQRFVQGINKLNYVILQTRTYFGVKIMENCILTQKLRWGSDLPWCEPWTAEAMSQPQFWARLKICVLSICLFFMLRNAIFAHPCPGRTLQLRKIEKLFLFFALWLSSRRECQKEGRDW